MKKKNYSVTLFWDKSSLCEETKMARVMLTVNLHRRQFRISLRMRATKEDFEKSLSGRGGSDSVKLLRMDSLTYITKAESILDKLPSPSKEAFTRLFKSETDLFLSNKTNIVPFFSVKLQQLKKEERYATYSNSKLALTSLLKYKAVICFEDIDQKWLKGYVTFMHTRGNSVTTANIYLRALRTIFNDVIKAGFVSEKHYSFKGFAMGSRIKSKDVLYPVQLKALLEYKTTGIKESRAKAFFFFCYLSNGMNFRDLAMLRWKNIQGNMITFVRHKTRNATANGQKEIKVYMHDLTKTIIKEWSSESLHPDDFIFPILNNKMTAEHVEKTITRYKRVSNKMLAPIGRKLGFEVHLCLNLARHSFATKLKLDNKVSLAAISDALGHTTTTTTEHYMKSLPDEYVKEMSKNLLEFT